MANKSLIKALFALIVSLVSLFVSSCSMDLEPSWKKGTTLSIELGAATTEQSRALLTQSGYLYICPDSKVLGPYEISAGTRFSTTEVEPGTYKRFILVYSPYKLPSEDINSALNGSAPFAEAIAANVSGRASWGSASGVTIKPSTDNLIAMTLVPAVASNLVIDPSKDELEVPVAPDSGESVVSRFIRIDSPLSSASTVLGLELHINAQTASASLPRANIPAVIPVFTRDGKASSVFTLKDYKEGNAVYTGASPAGNDSLYISVSFTPDAERSAIHVKLVQMLDKPVEPEYTTYMKVGGTGTYLNKRFFAYVHEITGAMQADQNPVAFGIAIATGTSVDIGLLDTASGEPWTPDAAKTYMAGFFVDVENLWPDFADPDIMTYVNNGQFFYGGLLHTMNDAAIPGTGLVAALAAFDCKNLVAVKSATLYVNDGTTKTDYQMLNPNGDGTLRIPMPLSLTSVKGRFVEWNTKADGTGTVYKAQGVYTGTADELVLYATWIAETSLPKGLFTVSLSGQSANEGKQVFGILSEVLTDNNETRGIFFGKIANDGTFSASFTDWVGIPLTDLPEAKYNVTLVIDKDGVLPALDYLHLYFDFPNPSLFSFKQVNYTGSGGFNQVFTDKDFMTLRTITAYPNYPGATEAPVVIQYPDGEKFTFAPQMTTFSRSSYTLAGWAKTANATTPEFTTGSTVTVTQDMILYAVWKEDVVVPEDIFKATLINAQSAVGKKVLGLLLSKADMAGTEKKFTGLFIGTVASDGSCTGTFADPAGKILQSIPADTYGIELLVDSSGTWPVFTSIFDFVPGSGTKVGYLEHVYAGTGGFNVSLDYATFSNVTSQYSVTLYPNWPDAPEQPVVLNYPDGYELTLSPQMTPFYRSGHTLVGWAKTANATTPEFTTGSTVTVTQDMILYAVWKEDVVVPEGIFKATLTNAQSAVGRKVLGILVSKEDMAATEEKFTGLFIGTVASDGSCTGTFADPAGNVLQSIPADTYAIELLVDSLGTWPDLTNIVDFLPGNGTKVYYVEHEYAGTGGINVSLDYSTFMTLYSVTLYPNWPGSTDEPVTKLYSGTFYYTESGTFVRPEHALIGWSTVPGGTTAEYGTNQSTPLTGELSLYAIWGPAASVTFTISMPDNSDPVLSPEYVTVPAMSTVTLKAPAGFTSYEWSLNAGYGYLTLIGSGEVFEYSTDSLIPGTYEIVLSVYDSMYTRKTASFWLTVQ